MDEEFYKVLTLENCIWIIMFTKYTKLCAIVYNQCAVKGMKLSSQDLGKTWATDFKKTNN